MPDSAHDFSQARPVLAKDVRAEVIEELSTHVRDAESGASPLRPLGHIFRDPATEERVVKLCRSILNLVSYRRRSTGEILAKLREKEDDQEVIAEAMARLERGGVIDDTAFAREWVEQRRSGKLLGTAALRAELEAKSVDTAIIDSVLAALEADDDGERDRCQALVRSRLEKELRAHGRSGADRAKLARKVGAAAMRRGYSRNLTTFVLARELDALGVTRS